MEIKSHEQFLGSCFLLVVSSIHLTTFWGVIIGPKSKYSLAVTLYFPPDELFLMVKAVECSQDIEKVTGASFVIKSQPQSLWISNEAPYWLHVWGVRGWESVTGAEWVSLHWATPKSSLNMDITFALVLFVLDSLDNYPLKWCAPM